MEGEAPSRLARFSPNPTVTSLPLTRLKAYVPEGAAAFDPTKPLSAALRRQFDSAAAREAGVPTSAEAQTLFAHAQGQAFDAKDFMRFTWQKQLIGCPLHYCLNPINEKALALFIEAVSFFFHGLMETLFQNMFDMSNRNIPPLTPL